MAPMLVSWVSRAAWGRLPSSVGDCWCWSLNCSRAPSRHTPLHAGGLGRIVSAIDVWSP